MVKNTKKSAPLPSLTNPIAFNTVDVSYRLRDTTHLRNWITLCANREGYKIGFLSYNFCSDTFLLQMNKQHLNHDYFTDIITFELSSGKELSGDIYISIDRVREHAKLYNISIKEELHRVMIHGVLHLCGYHDKTKKQKLVMRTKEAEFLSLRQF
ncbi:MAG: rRNA maturation RNase YbeY [Bacteroidota bacterium]